MRLPQKTGWKSDQGSIVAHSTRRIAMRKVLPYLGASLSLLALTGLKAGGGLIPEDAKRQIREDLRWLREQSS